MMAANRVVALVSPTTSRAWTNDRDDDDNGTGSASTHAAVAGDPHLTVPMGRYLGMYLGLSILFAARTAAAVLLLGHHATGKSTLTWCLLQRGWRLISSELTVVDFQSFVLPGIQQLKLWHDSAEQLGLDWAQLPPVRRGLQRYALLPPAVACAERPLPLSSLYAVSYTPMTLAATSRAMSKVVTRA